MATSRIPPILALLLLFGSGALLFVIGTPIPLLIAAAGVFIAYLTAGQRRLSSAWIGSIGAIAIFLSGTPLTGGPPDALLISAVMAMYFIGAIQLLKPMPLSSAGTTSGPYTLMFYGSLLIAYLLLSNRLFPFPFVIGIFLATLFILVSLTLWECSRRSRLAQAGQVENPGFPDWISRFCVATAILLVTFLLFRLPLPWIANETLDVAQELNLTSRPASQDRKRQSGDQGWNERSNPLDQDSDSNNEAEGGNGDEVAGSDGSRWRRGRLPKNADLEPRDVARLHLRLPIKEQAERALGRTLYIRAHSLGLYTNGQWTRANYAGRWFADNEDGERDGWIHLRNAPDERIMQQRYYLYNHLRGGSLPTMTNILSFKGANVFHQSDDFISNREAGDVSYEVRSAPLHYEDILSKKDLEVDEAPAHFLTKGQGPTFRDIDNLLLAPIQANEDLTLKQKLTYIRRLFSESYEYSLKVENPQDRDPLANFLFHEKVGYCDFFAQAGAHLLRGIGVPSRVAYGYAGGLYDPAQKLYTFRESDAHAWTEILLRGHGWVIFDLVPNGEGPRHAAEVAQTGSRYGDPLTRFQQAEEDRQDVGRTDAPRFDTDLGEWWSGLWIIRYLDLVLGGLLIGLIATYIWRRWKARGDGSADSPSARFGKKRSEPPGYFRDFCELFAARGHPRAPGQTLREFIAHLKDATAIRGEFDEMLSYHYTVEYEGSPRSKADEKRFKLAIKAFGAQTQA